MTNRTISLDDTLYAYLLNYSLREEPLLTELRELTAQLPEARFQIAPEQGQFMRLLVELLAPKRILEIGTFTGYSSICMARAMPDDAEFISCDISETWTAIAKTFWEKAELQDKIQLKLGPALETLETLLNDDQQQAMDLIFIDADKENYLQYFQLGLALLRPGGLMLFDNTLWSGRVADPSNQEITTLAIRELNTVLHSDERISLSVVPIGDGLSLVRKR